MDALQFLTVPRPQEAGSPPRWEGVERAQPAPSAEPRAGGAERARPSPGPRSEQRGLDPGRGGGPAAHASTATQRGRPRALGLWSWWASRSWKVFRIPFHSCIDEGQADLSPKCSHLFFLF